MPACRRETVGWFSTSSQLGARPIFKPSVTSVAGSTFRSSRLIMNLVACVCITNQSRGKRVKGKRGKGNDEAPRCSFSPFPLFPFSPFAPFLSSAGREKDDLDDVDEHQRQHERRGDDVRREPELQKLVEVDQRVHAPERDGRLDGFQEELARLRVKPARLLLILAARRGQKLRQLLAPEILPQKVTEGEDLAAHLSADELAQGGVAALADLGERLAQLRAPRVEV